MIIWQNQHIGKVQRQIRTGIVTVITIVLLLLSFGGIIVSKYYQDVAASDYDISMCGSTVIS